MRLLASSWFFLDELSRKNSSFVSFWFFFGFLFVFFFGLFLPTPLLPHFQAL